jgi:hypothetical protein
MPESWAVDNVAWRKWKEFHAHDGSAWRKAKEVHVHDGSAWRKVFSGFTPTSPLNYLHEAYYGSNTTAGFYWNSDGTITGTRTAYPSSTYYWGDPVSAGIGSEYWLRATFVSGVRYSGSAFGVWHSLASPPYWTCSTYPGLVAELIATIELATDSGGSNIVSSGTMHVYAEKIV